MRHLDFIHTLFCQHLATCTRACVCIENHDIKYLSVKVVWKCQKNRRQRWRCRWDVQFWEFISLSLSEIPKIDTPWTTPEALGVKLNHPFRRMFDCFFFVSSHLKYEITYRKLALRMCVGFRREPSGFDHASMRLIDSIIDLNFKPYLSIYSINLIVLVFELRTHINRHIPQITYKKEAKKTGDEFQKENRNH